MNPTTAGMATFLVAVITAAAQGEWWSSVRTFTALSTGALVALTITSMSLAQTTFLTVMWIALFASSAIAAVSLLAGTYTRDPAPSSGITTSSQQTGGLPTA